MIEMLNKAKTQWLAYRMAVAWFVMFSVNSLCTSILASLTGAKWDSIDWQQKFLICVSVLGNWTGTIMAFFSKQSQKMGVQISDGNTEQFTKL
jgi:sterol desaturase/sphingolipid hydroxylase (fatty acid hydroxylase superfamily)